MELDFADLRKQNMSRLQRWHGDSADWTGADWANAMGGEEGEMAEIGLETIEALQVIVRVNIATGTVQNTIKKIRRHETGLGTSYNTPELDALRTKLAEEIADVIIYADLLANHYGIFLSEAVRAKFNKVSVGNGFPERL